MILPVLLSHPNMRNGADISNGIPLHYAARGLREQRCSGIPMMEYLIGLGADVNAMDDVVGVRGGRGQRGTPLQYAILAGGRRKEVEWLLEHGADPDKQAPFGRSARSDVQRIVNRPGGRGQASVLCKLLDSFDSRCP